MKLHVNIYSTLLFLGIYLQLQKICKDKKDKKKSESKSSCSLARALCNIIEIPFSL